MLEDDGYAHTLLSVRGQDIDLRFSCLNDVMYDCQTRKGNYIYEPEVVHALCSFVRAGDICIDAGAADGYHTLLMSRLVGDAGSVFSFEPDPYCFAMLQANIVVNQSLNVQAVPIALWDDNGVAELFVGERDEYRGYSGFFRYANIEQRGMDVVARRLDDLIDPDRHIRLIKIDCEGLEEKILHGAERLLRRGVDYVIAEFNSSIMPSFGATTAGIRAYMKTLGYDFFILFKDGTLPLYVPSEIDIAIDPKRVLFNGMFSKPGLVTTWCPMRPKVNDGA